MKAPSYNTGAQNPGTDDPLLKWKPIKKKTNLRWAGVSATLTLSLGLEFSEALVNHFRRSLSRIVFDGRGSKRLQNSKKTHTKKVWLVSSRTGLVLPKFKSQQNDQWFCNSFALNESEAYPRPIPFRLELRSTPLLTKDKTVLFLTAYFPYRE